MAGVSLSSFQLLSLRAEEIFRTKSLSESAIRNAHPRRMLRHDAVACVPLLMELALAFSGPSGTLPGRRISGRVSAWPRGALDLSSKTVAVFGSTGGVGLEAIYQVCCCGRLRVAGLITVTC